MRSEPQPRLPSDRRRLVAAVEEALRGRARRRIALRRGLGVATAVAAALALLVGSRASWQASHAPPRAKAGPAASPRALAVLGAGDGAPGQIIAGDGVSRAVERGMNLGAGLRLVAPASAEVRLGTAEGTQVTLEPRGELAVVEAGETKRLALRSGAVGVRVKRLFAGERFVIDTTDAEVEADGAAFRLALVRPTPGCGHGTATRLSVLEGAVSMRSAGRETRLGVGDEWPTGCAQAARNEPAIRHPAARPSDRRDEALPAPRAAAIAPSVPSAPEALPKPSPAPASSLAAENDLFAAAVRAKNAGQPTAAIRMFDQLIETRPNSPLLESALVQRMKVLARVDAAEGARAAAAYLARFPSGFARPEAEGLLARPAP